MSTTYRGYFVDIGPCIGADDKIWTISLNEHMSETPIVMLHGMGAGSALWVLNLDTISKSNPVHCIDLLGFARSSRPKFSSNPTETEQQMVKGLEAWRREMRLNSMILLGHSLGGFIATSYAISYPDRVRHLILADPWGFPEKPDDIASRYNLPIWVRAIAFLVKPLNPLWAVRMAGPFGPWLVQKARPDIMRKFSPLLGEDTSIVTQYIFQCNAQNPTGESAFHSMMTGFGWAKQPMLPRMVSLRNDVPITILYGSRSWVDHAAGDLIRAQRPPDSYLNIQIIGGAGHHVYADKSETFNQMVIEAVEMLSPSPLANQDKGSPTESQENLDESPSH
ncbi:hypothetical protein B566_EDAN004393 [Ephemera danica]|nr:hypothetical protein B566_EDAN004393 [Ephemera danica]